MHVCRATIAAATATAFGVRKKITIDTQEAWLGKSSRMGELQSISRNFDLEHTIYEGDGYHYH
jgi:hypothetical protein